MELKDLPKEEQEKHLADLEKAIEAIEDTEERESKRRTFKWMKESGWIYNMFLKPETTPEEEKAFEEGIKEAERKSGELAPPLVQKTIEYANGYHTVGQIEYYYYDMKTLEKVIESIILDVAPEKGFDKLFVSGQAEMVSECSDGYQTIGQTEYFCFNEQGLLGSVIKPTIWLVLSPEGDY